MSNGFSARVFAVHNSIPKPIQIAEGTLEIIIYDGDASRDQSLKPRQVWSFSGTDLPRYLRETSIGFGYDFILKIDRSKPLPGKVSIGAKYTPARREFDFRQTGEHRHRALRLHQDFVGYMKYRLPVFFLFHSPQLP